MPRVIAASTIAMMSPKSDPPTSPRTVTMGYNAAGQRARYTVAMSGTATVDERFGYRDGALAQMAAMTATLNGDGSIKSTGSYTDTYVYTDGGQPLELLRQQGSGTKRYWYVLDGRGNVVAVTDSSGAVVDRYAYDPWGEGLPEGTSETVTQPFRYAGYWWDKELGWYWVNVRSYDPEGRWLQPDPSEQDGVRTYAYVGDDPIDWYDPSGLVGGPNCLYAHGQVIACAGTRGDARLGQGLYMFLIGDDLNTLGSANNDPAHLALKGLAVVDIVSNVTILIPFAGEGARVGAKLAFYAVRKAVAHSVEDVGERQAVHILDQGVKDVGRDLTAECKCFPAGTKVSTPHGLQPIETLHVGDQVLSENPKTGKVEAEPVQRTITDPVSPLIVVNLTDSSAVTVTADHPFWVDGGPRVAGPAWVQAGQLRPGDRLRTASGVDAVVGGLRRNVGHAVVYTLTVAHDHTYFVGAARVLVHNACPVGGQPRGGVYVLRDKATSAIVRTGRSKNLAVRQTQHGRDAFLGVYRFDEIYRTDKYAEQRGLEDLLYRENPNLPLNKMKAISPTNPNITLYRDAARAFMKQLGLPYLEP